MAIKRDKVDAIFSKLIRERADWSCERCGKHFPSRGGKEAMGLHCSHLYSRRHTRTRHDPDNAVAHCFTCHQWLGENPVDFANWIEDYIGVGRLEILSEKAHSECKMTKKDKEAQYQHLKAEYSRMMALREEGQQGRIEFTGFL